VVILGIKHLVWFALVLLGSMAFCFSVSGQGVTVYITPHENNLKAGQYYLISVSAPDGWIVSNVRINTSAYTFDFGDNVTPPGFNLMNGQSAYVQLLPTWPSGGPWNISNCTIVINKGSGFDQWSATGDYSGIKVYGYDSGIPDPPGPSYSLGVSVPTGEGEILNVNEGVSVQSEVWEYEEGTVVNLVAVPALGWSFHSWNLDNGNIVFDNPISLTMNETRTAEARFVDQLNPEDPDDPGKSIKRSEWWGTYEKDAEAEDWERWKLWNDEIAYIERSGSDVMVYRSGHHLIGYMLGNEISLWDVSYDERYYLRKYIGDGWQDFGYIDGNDIIIGNRSFSWDVGTLYNDKTGSFLGQACTVSFGNLQMGKISFYDEYGLVEFLIIDRFWTGHWTPDDPFFDPEDPETYPEEPGWKDVEVPPKEPGIFDDLFEELQRWLVDFIKKYFFPSESMMKFHANDLKAKASERFPFSLFWIPERLVGEAEEATVGLLDLSMFGVEGFKIDFYNNENMVTLAAWMRNMSRYLLWLMFILWLRDNITPTLVID